MSYNRHLMQTNMAAIKFRDINSTFTIRNVFMALRQNAEKRKYELLDLAVKDDMNVAIK